MYARVSVSVNVSKLLHGADTALRRYKITFTFVSAVCFQLSTTGACSLRSAMAFSSRASVAITTFIRKVTRFRVGSMLSLVPSAAVLIVVLRFHFHLCLNPLRMALRILKHTIVLKEKDSSIRRLHAFPWDCSIQSGQ